MSLVQLETKAALRAHFTELRGKGLVGLVPTMGALHAGHAALIDAARSECRTVIVSVFVNPLQFGPGEDLDRYPRTPDQDRVLCVNRGVDVLFVPGADEMYPDTPRTRVCVDQLSDGLCGAGRPGHFEGVATVVTKLFNLVQPDLAYFGEKDAQQLTIVTRLVKDLEIPVEIRSIETVREPDGLAVSSRNGYLSQAEREVAVELYRSLRAAAVQVESGEDRGHRLEEEGRRWLEALTLFQVDYFHVVDPATMQPVSRIEGPVLIAAAVQVGGTRLIDNVRAVPPACAEEACPS